MSDNDTTVGQEDEQKDLEVDQDSSESQDQGESQDDGGQKSTDPLDSIDDVETLRTEAKKFRGIAGRHASKPSQESKPEQKQEKPAAAQKGKPESFDLEDVAVLVSKVSEKEDREIVKKYALVEGTTLEDALKDPIVKGILKQKQEERASANATNTGNGRRGSSQPSLDQVLANADRGIFPEDPELLAEARMHAKKNKK